MQGEFKQGVEFGKSTLVHFDKIKYFNSSRALYNRVTHDVVQVTATDGKEAKVEEFNVSKL